MMEENTELMELTETPTPTPHQGLARAQRRVHDLREAGPASRRARGELTLANMELLKERARFSALARDGYSEPTEVIYKELLLNRGSWLALDECAPSREDPLWVRCGQDLELVLGELEVLGVTVEGERVMLGE